VVYADDDDNNLLRGGIRTTNTNTKHLLVATKEIGLDVNIQKTKYLFVPGDQHTGKLYKIMWGNKSFESVEEFKYSVKIRTTTKNCIPEGIKSRLKSGSGCFHSVQNILTSVYYQKV
jgi:uncharacterized protein YwbE